ncbi:MAG: type II secretion system protein GspM [Deltaproteobacteria bacterium]|jgi:general secretion pathway protein M
MIDRISLREKVFLLAGIAFILLFLLWIGVIAPYRQGIEMADSHIASRSRQLEEIRQLQQEYLHLQKSMAAAERKLAQSDFSIFPFIEEVTTRTGVRDNLVSMRPQAAQMQGEFREDSVEIKLEKIHLDQLVKLLHAIESSNLFLNMKSLRIRSRFDNRTLLDTDLTISSFRKAA